MPRHSSFLLAAALALFSYGADAQTQLSPKQVQQLCKIPAGQDTSQPILLALAPSGPSFSYACYVLSGVTLTPATASSVATIVPPAPVPSPTFVDSLTPTGTIDGHNAVFTLPDVPNPLTSCDLHLNGLLLQQGVDYTIAPSASGSGSTITFIAQVNSVTVVPQPGDSLRAKYRK